jgi:hypothetical protein
MTEDMYGAPRFPLMLTGEIERESWREVRRGGREFRPTLPVPISLSVWSGILRSIFSCPPSNVQWAVNFQLISDLYLVL